MADIFQPINIFGDSENPNMSRMSTPTSPALDLTMPVPPPATATPAPVAPPPPATSSTPPMTGGKALPPKDMPPDTADKFAVETTPQPTKQPEQQAAPGRMGMTSATTAMTTKEYVSPEMVNQAETKAAAVEQKLARENEKYETELAKLLTGADEQTAQAVNAWNTNIKAASDDRYNKAVKFMNDYDAAIQNLQKIEPQKRSYWEMSSTAGKISGLLSVIGSSMIAYARKDPSFIDKATQRIVDTVNADFEQQRQRYERSKELLQVKREGFAAQQAVARDYEAILQAKKTMALEDIKNKLTASVSKIKEPKLQAEAKANVDRINAQLDVVKAKNTFAAMRDAAGTTTSQTTMAPTKDASFAEKEKAFNETLKDKGIISTTTTPSPVQKLLKDIDLQEKIRMARTGTPEQRRAASILIGQFISQGLEQGSFTEELSNQLIGAGLAARTKEGVARLVGNVEDFVSEERMSQLESFANTAVDQGKKQLAPALQDIKNRADAAGIDLATYGQLPGIHLLYRDMAKQNVKASAVKGK